MDGIQSIYIANAHLDTGGHSGNGGCGYYFLAISLIS
jgi:hypothetical protein